jgi:hypothetical protein
MRVISSFPWAISQKTAAKSPKVKQKSGFRQAKTTDKTAYSLYILNILNKSTIEAEIKTNMEGLANTLAFVIMQRFGKFDKTCIFTMV